MATVRAHRFLLTVFLGGTLLSLPMLAPGASSSDARFRSAVPGYQYRFPWDLGSHDDFQTEWWYYTGHLHGPDQRTYGYQLTFFRRGVAAKAVRENPSRWAVRNIYFAHFAVTDETQGKFRFAEKLSRGGVGKAGAETGTLYVWIDQWRTQAEGKAHRLSAHEPGMAVELTLLPEKPVVVHGHQGTSKKGEGASEASHYYSFTRMKTEGTVWLDGREIPVNGLSWMDHEFGSNQLGAEQIGWDWFSLQLNDGSELMLYQIRRRDGTIEPSSGGTWINRDGSSVTLKREDVTVSILDVWRSTRSGATYPSRWNILIPSLGLTVEVSPTVRDQELATKGSTQITYWEGSATVKGDREGRQVSGQGYVELTGYATALQRRL